MTNQFAENLKHIMAAREVNNMDIERRTGISNSTISGYKTGRFPVPGPKNLTRLATALNCSIKDLTGPSLPTHICRKDYKITPELMKQVCDHQHGRIPYIDATTPSEASGGAGVDSCPSESVAPATEALVSSEGHPWDKQYIISLFLATVKEKLDEYNGEDIFTLFGKAVFQAAMNE